MKQIYSVITILMFAGLSLMAQTTELEITSSLDNTIFQDLALSNGVGEYIFTGKSNAGVVRRALVQFDLADVPAGVTVDSAFLILTPVKVKPDSAIVAVHRVLTEWGEGSSRAEEGDGKGAPATAGDATWTHAKHPANPWVKSGGDYVIESSAVDTVRAGTEVAFRSDKLTLDVNFWLQNPSNNYGWILIGNEVNNATSAKFGSRDNNDTNVWPALKLYYQGTTSIDEKFSGSEMHVSQVANSDALLVMNPYEPGRASIEIYSITGAMLWSKKQELVKGNNHIPAGSFDTGIYLYRISLNGISNSGKLLITNR